LARKHNLRCTKSFKGSYYDHAFVESVFQSPSV